MGEAAWSRLTTLLRGPLPEWLPSGTYKGGDPAAALRLREIVGFSYGILEATQSLLVSAAIVSDLVFEPDKAGPRLRDRPRLVASRDFPELADLDLPELKHTAARNSSVHLKPFLRKWHRRFPPDHPSLISTWFHGPGPDSGESYRFLDTKGLRVRVGNEWSDLGGLAKELGLIGNRIPFRAQLRREDPSTASQ
ncbi:MAG: hypothetical protein L3K05_03000 [Thermoplasmata archaeon]|nr:hypothetical protein [Thermoplasmata archaeon]